MIIGQWKINQTYLNIQKAESGHGVGLGIAGWQLQPPVPSVPAGWHPGGSLFFSVQIIYWEYIACKNMWLSITQFKWYKRCYLPMTAEGYGRRSGGFCYRRWRPELLLWQLGCRRWRQSCRIGDLRCQKTLYVNQPNKFCFQGHILYCYWQKMITIGFTGTMYVCLLNKLIEVYHATRNFAIFWISLQIFANVMETPDRVWQILWYRRVE